MQLVSLLKPFAVTMLRLISSKLFYHSSVCLLLNVYLCLLCYSPSRWGILDFREEGVHPSPNLPRAKKFLPEEEIDQLMAMSKRIIEEAKSKIGKSAKSFLDALSRSDIISLSVLAKEKGAHC